MKRLFGLLKDREASGGSAPPAESREAWSPDSNAPAPVANPPPQGASEFEDDRERPISPSLSVEGEGEAGSAEAARSRTDLLPIEGHALETPVIDALKSVYDPEIPVNIYELGLIYDVKLSPENDVFVKMTLTAPGCPVAHQMPGMVRAAVEEHVPEAREVDVEIVWDPPWRPDMMSEAARLETGML